tara:strand:- start:334 stop:1656 length:1323 start_codon:yes stop_codon:yes gene_type:complete
MRFYFSAIDYDVLNNCPHFPGYPLYCLILKCFYVLTNSLELSFSIIGGLSIFLIIYFSTSCYQLLFQESNHSWCLSLLLLFNPLLWLMSNRYMPDIFGLAILLICLFFFLSYFNSNNKKYIFYLAFFTAILAGVRISYLPFLIPIYIFLIKDFRLFVNLIVATILFCLLWLIPWILTVGAEELYFLATNNTYGHFYKWGGTIYSSENTYFVRLIRFCESIIAHSFNCWWPGRNPFTLINSFTLLVLLFGFLKKRSSFKTVNRNVLIIIICIIFYGLWVFLFQNISYKPRHILPFIPFISMLLTDGGSLIKRNLRSYIVISMCLFGFIFSTIKIVSQHTNDSAISQLKNHLNSIDYPVCVHIQNDLMKYYVSNFLTNTNVVVIKSLNDYYHNNKYNDMALISTSSIPSYQLYKVEQKHFFHNPYVNRLWNHIEISEYNKSH